MPVDSPDMAATRDVLSLTDITPELREEVGEKAYRVAQLAREGFRVPDGFVITASARRRAQSGQQSEVEASIRRAVNELFAKEPVAVRSSGTAEDLAGASFAGMYETVLDVRGEEAVLAAVQTCWESARNERVRTYCTRAGINPDTIDLALLVQRMVEAETAGVLFTIDPTTGDEGEMACEAVTGLGEALVSGQVTPDRYRLARANGSVLEEVLSGESPILSPEQLTELVTTGCEIQRRRGAPQDIEFAFAEGQLHLLQTRPITTLHFAERLGEWTTADFRDGGVASSVCSPYMASLYTSAIQQSMPSYFADLGLHDPSARQDWIRVFFGRPYWNVGAVKTCVSKIPGYVERNFDTDLGIDVAYEGTGQTTPTNLRTVLGAIPVLLRLKRVYREHLRCVADMVKDFETTESRYLAVDPWTLPREELVERYQQLVSKIHLRIESNYFRTIYNLSNAKLDFQTVLDRANARGADLAYINLLAGIDELRTLAPTRDLHVLSGKIAADSAVAGAFAEQSIEELVKLHEIGRHDPESVWAEIEAYLQTYRYHSRKELDITVPRWDEDLPHVLAAIRSVVSGHDLARDPAALAAGQRRTQEEAVRRARAFFGLRRPLASRKFFDRLRRVRDYTWWREEVRDRSTRTYYLVRREALALARRLVDEGSIEAPEDLWMLTWPETIDLAEGRLEPEEARRRIAANRAYCESYTSYDNPDEIGWRWKTGGPAAPPPASGEALEGTGGSPGRVEGTARIVGSVEEGEKLQPGDILVAPFTDPGWTPFLGIVGAVVTETGGLLSHAAVISREYGIPAVLAVPNATRILADGERIVVDGSNGRVERFES